MRCLAILVNYHCTNLVIEAANSLAADPECDEIRIVDNSESEIEVNRLILRLPAKTVLMVSKCNLGFAQACNWALDGVETDAVLLLNPDARLFPGALARLKKTLIEFKSAGAVGPRVYWDNERNFLMPPSTYPSRFNFFLDLLGLRWRWVATFKERQFRKKAIAYWTSEKPMHLQALSGGHVLLRHTALRSVNGLFDAQFFMYWEDTDLMRRLNDRGWWLLMEPRAEAVHWYEHHIEKNRLIGLGWPIYYEKYFSSRIWRLLSFFLIGKGNSFRVQTNYKLLISGSDDQYLVPVPERIQSSWLLEISPSPNFVPSIGRFGEGSIAPLPVSLAKRFTGNYYYVRVNGVTFNSFFNTSEKYRFSSP